MPSRDYLIGGEVIAGTNNEKGAGAVPLIGITNTNRAASAVMDSIDETLDGGKVEKLRGAFNCSVDIWEQAGLFTEDRAQAGYVKPVFERDLEPLLTEQDMSMAEDGESLDKGYKTPVFSPMDVPLCSENAEELTYLTLLKDALIEAFRGTMGGKAPDTLLVGPNKRVITADQVNLDDIMWQLDSYFRMSVVHNVHRLDKSNHGGVTENELLSGLEGTDRRIGGVVRIERDRSVMPSDLGAAELRPTDWEKKLQDALPSVASVQDIKQAIAYTIYCLKTYGWIPDCFDSINPENSRLLLALKSFIPDEGLDGAVPALYWFMCNSQLFVHRTHVNRRDSNDCVRVGVKKRGV